jgi:hypothetical protein
VFVLRFTVPVSELHVTSTLGSLPRFPSTSSLLSLD